MGKQVKVSRGVCAQSEGEEHVSKLRHGGVRQHLLDVVLLQANGSGEQGGEQPNHHDDFLGERSQCKQHIRANDEVDARGNHGGGVDEGRNRCWAGHRIREPGEQWELSRFSDSTDKQQQGSVADERIVHVDGHRFERNTVVL